MCSKYVRVQKSRSLNNPSGECRGCAKLSCLSIGSSLCIRSGDLVAICSVLGIFAYNGQPEVQWINDLKWTTKLCGLNKPRKLHSQSNPKSARHKVTAINQLFIKQKNTTKVENPVFVATEFFNLQQGEKSHLFLSLPLN